MPPDGSARLEATVLSSPEHVVSDFELRELLTRVYVGEGFTDPEVAKVALEPEQVRTRGKLLFVRSAEQGVLAGMVMVVPATSLASRFAKVDEAELHLLATAPEFRRAGVGRRLVTAALTSARNDGLRRMLLWTQPSMQGAQVLYENLGFERVSTRDFTAHERAFLFYERAL